MLALDVCDDAQVRAAVEATGGVDILVSKAGYGLEGAVEEIGDAELFELYDTNVLDPGVVSCCTTGMRAQDSA